MRLLSLSSLILLLFFLGCTSPRPSGITVEVIRVVSGNTLEVSLNFQRQKVRLLGISAPDLRQDPWGKQAQNILESLLGQKPHIVVLETDTTVKDPYNRLLAYVWSDGTLLNEAIVRSGYALKGDDAFAGKYTLRLQRAQEYARIMGYGIWHDEQPMKLTPWEFRQQNKGKRNGELRMEN